MFSGSGTESDLFRISNVNDWKNFAAFISGKTPPAVTSKRM